ncbi:hypothetical protein AURDEDRAFT_126733 [Auricularia subglabra TFB-10046 SS5]|nr:hypothetical protein AURDEDRAFT_126733 [Auricularia subglabra TFB-10046 SS5]
MPTMLPLPCELSLMVFSLLGLADRITCTLVCHAWRACILDSGALWSSVRCRKMGTLAGLLRRAGNSPVDVHVTDISFFDLHEVVRILGDHIDHIRTLALYTGELKLNHFHIHVVYGLFKKPAPLLEVVDIQLFYRSFLEKCLKIDALQDPSLRLPPLLLRQAPKLRQLSFQTMTFPQTAGGGFLDLNDPNAVAGVACRVIDHRGLIFDLVGILFVVAPFDLDLCILANLVEIEIPYNELTGVQDEFDLPKLERLCLRVCAGETTQWKPQRLLEGRIRCPNLHTVELWNYPEDSTVSMASAQLLHLISDLLDLSPRRAVDIVLRGVAVVYSSDLGLLDHVVGTVRDEQELNHNRYTKTAIPNTQDAHRRATTELVDVRTEYLSEMASENPTLLPLVLYNDAAVYLRVLISLEASLARTAKWVHQTLELVLDVPMRVPAAAFQHA